MVNLDGHWGLEVAAEPYAFPIKIPAANTSEPPSTTCSTARQKGVCM